jgi:stage II sporulation protein D
VIFHTEPHISVGLIENAAQIDFELQGDYLLDGRAVPAGCYRAVCAAGVVALSDGSSRELIRGRQVCFKPVALQDNYFTLHNVAIGHEFHWERLQSQRFRGELAFAAFGHEGITAMNRIGLEAYLESVICSEMSPESDSEFLKAHCVISRSWLLAQLELKRAARVSDLLPDRVFTDAAFHKNFDVCNDDHCQRYHGIGRVNPEAQHALAATRGQVLMSDGEICDTRFSKCCGGISERFSTCWQDADFAYLKPVADCAPGSVVFCPPVSDEAAARRFILADPPAFCNVNDPQLLARVLPDFDCETQQFFRWSVTLSQAELQGLLLNKTGIDFGGIKSLSPLARGDSGRIYELKITGTKAEKIISKELAIRRALSSSHLYSSAFIVEASAEKDGLPEAFTLRGAGWGHGVGLCQIGAAAMAAQGHSCSAILAHYFRGAALKIIY